MTVDGEVVRSGGDGQTGPHGDGSGSPDLGAWIGRGRRATDVLTVERARKLAATLDLDPTSLRAGAPLPPGWHWVYFHQVVARSRLADDGHERRGDFLPPVPLDRRMWAGGRLRFHRPLELDSRVERISSILSVEEKEGRSGLLVLVTVGHRLVDDDGVALEEEQDLVYLDRPRGDTVHGGRREDTGSGDAGSRQEDAREPGWSWSRPFSADEVTLFRFSALTFNGHRIHYDRPYATEVEGYPDLVVHGPLLAILLLGAGNRWSEADPADALSGWSFGYRARRPVFCREEVRLLGRRDPDRVDRSLELEIAHPGRGTVMTAELRRR